jgi:hypothetical protein
MRGLQALPSNLWLKTLYTFLFLLLALSFVVYRFTGHTSLFLFNHIITWAGAFWLAAAFYFLLAVILVDIVRLVNTVIHFLPSSGSPEYNKLKLLTLATSVIIVFLLLIAGYINAINPKIKYLNINISKTLANKKEIKIAAVSDIHLGTLVGKGRLEKLVNLVNAKQPDIIILAGDILDEEQGPIIRENIGQPLTKLKAPMGVYAIPGNHEYIGGINRAKKYIESLGIILLCDSVVNINNMLVLIGRDDISSYRFYGTKRKPLKDLMFGIDTSKFLLLLDHQPFHLQDAANRGIDLQISGHTHKGQLWPVNYITHAVYELDYGYIQKGNTHYYVTSGYGNWGPPVRIGNRPEIVVFNLKFN